MDVDHAGGAAVRAVAFGSRAQNRFAAHRGRCRRGKTRASFGSGEDRGDARARMIPESGRRFSEKIMRKNNMKVVIAGFGPFPGAPSNPSGRLAIALARRRRPALAAGVEITSHVFATA